MQKQSILYRYFPPNCHDQFLLGSDEATTDYTSSRLVNFSSARMKLEMMRHRSRLWRTFLSCLGAIGPALAMLLSAIKEEDGAAISNIGLGWRTLHCCDANSHSWRNRTKMPTRRHNTYSNSNEETRENHYALLNAVNYDNGWECRIG